MSFFDKFWPPQRNLSTGLLIPFLKNQVMKILLNSLFQTLCKLIVRRDTEEGGRVVYNKYLDWDCVNKRG